MLFFVDNFSSDAYNNNMFGFYDSYFKFFGLTVTYYGFLIALAMGMGVFIACKLAKLRGLKSDDILLLACYILPLAILGARTYYVIFSGESYSFLEFFKIWEGGLAILGGVIGGAVAIILFCLIHKKNFLDIADIAIISLILGQGIGRIGCYFAGCCYGIEVTDPSLMWFPLSTKIHGVWHLSTFFYESFSCFVIFGIFMFLILKKVKTRGIMSSLYLICYGTVRFILEALRDESESLYLGSVKFSQLLSGLMVVGGIILLVLIICEKKGLIKFNKKIAKANDAENESTSSEEKTSEIENKN